jgi:sirohydrochlorin cobaltochelatase
MEKGKEKIAIVLAQFGTSYLSALPALTNIQRQVQEAFPGVKISMAFTSNIIRRIWRKRRNDATFLQENSDIPEEILNIRAPLATIADLQDEGYATIIVQPTHVFEGVEYLDLKSCVDSLSSIAAVNHRQRLFKKIALGRPLLGKKGREYPYIKDLEIAAAVMEPDLKAAAECNAALVYMGHGNEYLSTGIYLEFREVLRKMHPNAPVYIATVEGLPGIDYLVAELRRDKIAKVFLKPFMIVAGDHALNDMAGDGDDSWKTILNTNGIEVVSAIQGLGENPRIAAIYIQHIRDAARDSGIEL